MIGICTNPQWSTRIHLPATSPSSSVHLHHHRHHHHHYDHHHHHHHHHHHITTTKYMESLEFTYKSGCLLRRVGWGNLNTPALETSQARSGQIFIVSIQGCNLVECYLNHHQSCFHHLPQHFWHYHQHRHRALMSCRAVKQFCILWFSQQTQRAACHQFFKDWFVQQVWDNFIWNMLFALFGIVVISGMKIIETTTMAVKAITKTKSLMKLNVHNKKEGRWWRLMCARQICGWFSFCQLGDQLDHCSEHNDCWRWWWWWWLRWIYHGLLLLVISVTVGLFHVRSGRYG